MDWDLKAGVQDDRPRSRRTIVGADRAGQLSEPTEAGRSLRETPGGESSFGWLIMGLGGLGLAALAGYGALRLRSKAV